MCKGLAAAEKRMEGKGENTLKPGESPVTFTLPPNITLPKIPKSQLKIGPRLS